MARMWRVSCRRTAPGGSGNASGEFSRMADALDFAEAWMGVGWVGTLTSPSGQVVEIERGKRPVFPKPEQRGS